MVSEEAKKILRVVFHKADTTGITFLKLKKFFPDWKRKELENRLGYLRELGFLECHPGYSTTKIGSEIPKAEESILKSLVRKGKIGLKNSDRECPLCNSSLKNVWKREYFWCRKDKKLFHRSQMEV